MSLDTKYRPRNYADVLGQKKTILLLKRFVQQRKGFQQSYVLAGAWGSGKTTLARILSRALLCDNPQDGAPCDKCQSCKSILETGSSEDFFEFDAATNSGKDDIKKLTEEAEFSTFSGKRRIYIIDESHRLSASALDALLKPLEENIRGTMDKKMVCIFCTTEPERMRATILSRCAPVFTIQPVPPEIIGERLQSVCKQEGFSCELEALVQIAEATESHVRDALKAIEGISKIGPISVENVRGYFHFDLNDTYLGILLSLRSDLRSAMTQVEDLTQRVSPVTCYQRFSDLCLMAFKQYIGVEKKVPVFWDRQKILELGDLYGEELIRFTRIFSSRPARPTGSMLACDLAQLSFPEKQIIQTTGSNYKKSGIILKREDGARLTENNVYVLEAAVNQPRSGEKKDQVEELSIADFCKLLDHLLREADGLEGRPDVGGD